MCLQPLDLAFQTLFFDCFFQLSQSHHLRIHVEELPPKLHRSTQIFLRLFLPQEGQLVAQRGQLTTKHDGNHIKLLKFLEKIALNQEQ